MEFVQYETRDRIAVIRLNRPERLNAMSAELRADLSSALEQYESDEQALVAIITGTGRAFCAGRDLKVQASSGSAPRPVYTPEWNLFGLRDTNKPLIAAVNGYAIGAGWYMTAGCDIRVAAESARFGMGEVPTGVLGPYWFSVTEVVPYAMACEFALLGEHVSAQRLLQLGLLNEVVPDDQLMDCAWKWARKFLSLPPQHVRKTKALMRAMRNLPTGEMLTREDEARAFLNDLGDTKEAVAAFAESRPPTFTGR